MEGRDNARADVIDPDPSPGSIVGILGEKMRLVVGIRFLQVFQGNSGLEQRLRGISNWTGQGRYKASWV